MRAKKGGKKAIGQFRGERCSAPVSFYCPLKKKRERMNILPVLIDFSSSASLHNLLLSTLLRSNNGRSYIYAGSVSSGCRKATKRSATNYLQSYLLCGVIIVGLNSCAVMSQHGGWGVGWGGSRALSG